MKSRSPTEFMSLAARPGTVRSFRPLAAEDTAKLVKFYLALDDEQRRIRFGAAIEDGIVRRHCRQIDWKSSLVIGCMNASATEAALEIHAFAADWRRAELAFTCHASDDRRLIAGHLLQLAAFAAGRLGCEQFIVLLDQDSHTLLPLLRGMGELIIQGDCASVELGDYAALFDGPPEPKAREEIKLAPDPLRQ